MESLEELTQERIKDLSQVEARALYDERNLLQSRLRQEMQMLMPIAFPVGKIIDADAQRKEAGFRKPVKTPMVKKCPGCGSTDLMLQKGNRVFCRQCNISSEIS